MNTIDSTERMPFSALLPRRTSSTSAVSLTCRDIVQFQMSSILLSMQLTTSFPLTLSKKGAASEVVSSDAMTPELTATRSAEMDTDSTFPSTLPVSSMPQGSAENSLMSERVPDTVSHSAVREHLIVIALSILQAKC